MADPFRVLLSCGRHCLVDPEDAETVGQHRWHRHPAGYAHTRKDGRMILMHRLLMNAPRGMEVDHINGDPLDNRRSNLRLVTHAQNQQNRHRAQVNSTTGARGVYWLPKRRCYEVRVKVNGKAVWCGYHRTVEAAAEAARAARARLYTHAPECEVRR